MSEKRLYLASSALVAEGYSAVRTIDVASGHGFYGVQLYVNQDYYLKGYVERLIGRLNEKHLSLIVHLPNIPTRSDLKVAQAFVNGTKDSLVLVHYKPLTTLPKIRGTKVGWENSVNAPDLAHIDEVMARVRKDSTFFVYDFGRLMYTDNAATKQVVRDFLSTTIPELRPDRDVIHIADKLYWHQRFRDCQCALGMGVMSEFLPQVQHFVSQGGRLVIEQEDLNMAIESIRVF